MTDATGPSVQPVPLKPAVALVATAMAELASSGRRGGGLPAAAVRAALAAVEAALAALDSCGRRCSDMLAADLAAALAPIEASIAVLGSCGHRLGGFLAEPDLVPQAVRSAQLGGELGVAIFGVFTAWAVGLGLLLSSSQCR